MVNWVLITGLRWSIRRCRAINLGCMPKNVARDHITGITKTKIAPDRSTVLVENQDTKYQFDRKVGYIASHQF
jgi:hypothetical protein